MSMPISHKEVPIRDALLKLRNILKGNAQKHILVIGDVMLDVYIRGTTERMSPEAPVPILKETTREYYLGGASNTALNVSELGAKTTLIGVIGNDLHGATIQKLTKEFGISAKLVIEKNLETTTKMRAVGPKGHMLRIDTEAVLPITKDTEKALIAHIEKLPKQHTVVISDYAKGVMTKAVIEALRTKFGGELLLVDTKPSRAKLYANIGLFKVNTLEAKEMTGIDIVSKESAKEALEVLQKHTKGSVVITRGAKGLSIYDKSTHHVFHLPPIKTNVKDVVGAGDTTLASLAFMLAHDVDLFYGAHAANYVASRTISKEGTTALTKEELLRDHLSK